LNKRAFSLIEMLVVMAIIAILGALVAPLAFSVQKSSAMTTAGQLLGNELSLARQEAISHNHDVEFRFYSYSDSTLPGGTPRIQAFQAFDYNASGAVTPLSKVIHLPNSIVLDSGATLSTLFAASQLKTWTATDTQPSLPSLGTSYKAYVFRFRADGETNLTPFPPPLWYLTVHPQSDGDALANPPKNYVTLVLDPVNGHFAVYLP
jgi:uncharacterized protein (TIGR02596 family)